MAQGKARNAKKAKSAAKSSGSAKPKGAARPSNDKSKKAVEKPAAPTPPAPPVPMPTLKKRNVKRGAPPMLPRRMVRRPEPGPPGSSPPPAPRPPSPPGSLHAPARAPEGAEGLKQRLSTVMSLIAQLRGLKRTINRQFFEAGLVLQKLSEPALYQAKGYGTFESFVEREIERELAIGRSMAHDLVQIVRVFQRDAAEEIGLDRLRQALRALWPEPGPAAASTGSATSG